LFADLAEKYLTDVDYEVGTVVSVGGDAEVTACSIGSRAFGAVSANPAYMMNAGLEGGTYIALKGRVPVKVIGPVKKGDSLIASDNGYCAEAMSILRGTPIRGMFPDTFAIALENNDNPEVKLVEAIIL
jgi:carbonic anhydrase/acetyltransferase-like protein (isoleucine patch superfamily)